MVFMAGALLRVILAFYPQNEKSNAISPKAARPLRAYDSDDSVDSSRYWCV